MSGLPTQPADTLDVHSAHRRLTLLVVPLGTDAATADRALQAAGRPGGVDDIAALLAR